MSSSSDESSSFDDEISIESGSSDPEVLTETLKKQIETEESVLSLFEKFDTLSSAKDFHMISLKKEKHIAFLRKGLFGKNGVSVGLYSAQAWVVYWCLQGLALLNALPTESEMKGLVEFLRRSKNEDGAFGASEGQMSHLAPTYAAVLSIAIIGTPEAYALIDREKLYHFLLSMKTTDAGFCMHEGGEVDVRASYIAMVVATLTNILTPTLRHGVADFVAACQSYEGGIGALPGAEAHGGYTFCGLAALVLLGDTGKLNTRALVEWAVQRQLPAEGGFQGRTNKLVDGCYAFWQGSVFPLIDMVYVNPSMYADEASPDTEPIEAWNEADGSWLMDQHALERYILLAAQNPGGGLRDKPSAKPDYYHTSYVLSGLSIAQHNAPYSLFPFLSLPVPSNINKDSIIASTHPVYNIPPRSVFTMKAQFSSLPLP